MLLPVDVRRLAETELEDAVDGLAEVLVDCVRGGANVGFLESLTVEEAQTWWRSVLFASNALTFVARDEEGQVVGCVRLRLAMMPNGRHRADVSKVLVHRRARGAGIASALLDSAESEAARQGRTLLVLDTETGSGAQSLYAGLGWRVVGIIEDYAASPDGVPAPTTVMVKHLPGR